MEKELDNRYKVVLAFMEYAVEKTNNLNTFIDEAYGKSKRARKTKNKELWAQKTEWYAEERFVLHWLSKIVQYVFISEEREIRKSDKTIPIDC